MKNKIFPEHPVCACSNMYNANIRDIVSFLYCNFSMIPSVRRSISRLVCQLVGRFGRSVCHMAKEVEEVKLSEPLFQTRLALLRIIMNEYINNLILFVTIRSIIVTMQ